MEGISIIGKSSFGTALVAGRKRVPKPATGMTAFLSFIDIGLNDPSRFSLFHLLARFTLYAECRHRTRFQTFDGDILSTFFANTVFTAVEPSQRFLNLEDKFAFTVADTQHRIPV